MRLWTVQLQALGSRLSKNLLLLGLMVVLVLVVLVVLVLLLWVLLLLLLLLLWVLLLLLMIGGCRWLLLEAGGGRYCISSSSINWHRAVTLVHSRCCILTQSRNGQYVVACTTSLQLLKRIERVV